jgi:hypothetical protein
MKRSDVGHRTLSYCCAANYAALKYGRNFSPDNRRGHSAPPPRSLVEVAPGIYPGVASDCRLVFDNFKRCTSSRNVCAPCYNITAYSTGDSGERAARRGVTMRCAACRSARRVFHEACLVAKASYLVCRSCTASASCACVPVRCDGSPSTTTKISRYRLRCHMSVTAKACFRPSSRRHSVNAEGRSEFLINDAISEHIRTPRPRLACRSFHCAPDAKIGR